MLQECCTMFNIKSVSKLILNRKRNFWTKFLIICSAMSRIASSEDVMKVCCLSQSVPHLPSCVLVTVGSWTVTRPASPAAYQMFVTPHSVEHLFNCQSHPMQLTVQDLWDNPSAVADFLNLDKRRATGLWQQQQHVMKMWFYHTGRLFTVQHHFVKTVHHKLTITRLSHVTTSQSCIAIF